MSLRELEQTTLRLEALKIVAKELPPTAARTFLGILELAAGVTTGAKKEVVQILERQLEAEYALGAKRIERLVRIDEPSRERDQLVLPCVRQLEET